MEFNPYEVLGVAKNATPKQIKRAYKKQAKKTHPDAGGSKEEFLKVNQSFLVLIDEDKRHQYDETGTIEEDDPKVDEATEIIVNLVNQLLEKDEFFYVDAVAIIKESINNGIKQINDEIKSTKRKLDKVIRAADRFKFSGKGTDVIGLALKSRIRSLESSIRQHEGRIQSAKKAHSIISNYKFMSDVTNGMAGDEWFRHTFQEAVKSSTGPGL